MESIIQNEKECFICKTKQDLHLHHIFYGSANRKISEEHGLKCWLCAAHHNMGRFSVHMDHDLDIELKQYTQKVFEKNHSREEFMELIGRSYI